MAFELLFIYLLTYLERKGRREKESKREREEGEREEDLQIWRAKPL